MVCLNCVHMDEKQFRNSLNYKVLDILLLWPDSPLTVAILESVCTKGSRISFFQHHHAQFLWIHLLAVSITIDCLYNCATIQGSARYQVPRLLHWTQSSTVEQKLMSTMVFTAEEPGPGQELYMFLTGRILETFFMSSLAAGPKSQLTALSTKLLRILAEGAQLLM